MRVKGPNERPMWLIALGVGCSVAHWQNFGTDRDDWNCQNRQGAPGQTSWVDPAPEGSDHSRGWVDRHEVALSYIGHSSPLNPLLRDLVPPEYERMATYCDEKRRLNPIVRYYVFAREISRSLAQCLKRSTRMTTMKRHQNEGVRVVRTLWQDIARTIVVYEAMLCCNKRSGGDCRDSC